MVRKKPEKLGRELIELLKETLDEWQNDNAQQLAAGMAFYTIFSAAPLLIITIAIASLAFGQEAARAEIVEQVRRWVGFSGTRVIENLLMNARTQSRLATIAGTAVALFGATAVFANLQSSLNAIWEVMDRPGKIIWPFIRKRLISFALVLVCGILVILSLVSTAALSAAGGFLPKSLGLPAYLLHISGFLASFLVTTLFFGLIFKVLPDVRITWSDVGVGAAVTSLLFNIGKSLIALYLGHSSLGSSYGAASSIVILLAWVYYSAQVFFFGAEFTQVYARRYSTPIGPGSQAVRFTRKIEDRSQ